jgi:uncharacterized protein (DUF4415 family)
MGLQFEWDPRKNVSNIRKHGVSFEEAQTVFQDEHARFKLDPGDINPMPLLPRKRKRHSDHFSEKGKRGRSRRISRVPDMRPHYDFSDSKPNPYTKLLKRQITIRLDPATIEYFQQMSAATGLPYQRLMNLYLRDCALSKRNLRFDR